MARPNHSPSSQWIEAIVENLPHGIVALDLQANVTYCNQHALNLLEIDKKPTEVIGLPVAQTLDSLPSFAKNLVNRVIQGAKPFDIVGRPFNNKFFTLRGRPIPKGMLISIEDVTAPKKLERTSMNAMLEGQEAERRRLAKEIHDGIGPVMSTIKLNLDAVKTELRGAPEKTFKKINVMGELIEHVADDIRDISHALMPSALMDLGLVLALENLCQKASESERVTVHFYHVGMEERLDLKLALNLYRVAQELLNNAFKYANAETINVQVIKHPKSILLMVEDDGAGFDPAKTQHLKENGIGLRNIETRARLLNATFNIETQPGNGVLATIEVPLNKKFQ